MSAAWRIGAQLRERRLALAMTQRELGARLGWQLSRVSDYESDRRLPTLPSLARMLAALGLTLVCDGHSVRLQPVGDMPPPEGLPDVPVQGDG